MRVPQEPGEKGSLKWMQHLVNERSSVLDALLADAIVLAPGETIDWKSPLVGDSHAEYRDGSWLKQIGRPELESALKSFWPSRGPQWDALAVTSAGRVILVEAKAHLEELKSPGSAAGETSAKIIGAALKDAKQSFNVAESVDWAGTYYQYANRLAHLHFLRKNGVPVELVFLYIVGDQTMSRGATPEEWKVGIASAHRALGLGKKLENVHEVFVDVRDLG